MTETVLSPKRQFSNSNVLVVDDDIALCRILHRMLADEQYIVETAQSVADALRSIEQRPFDIYVMDYKLQDGGGIDVAKRIRSKGSEAPIILISGYDPSAIALKAEHLHISDYLVKPFSRATLCNAVKKAIGSPPANPPPAGVASERSPTKPSFLQAAVRAITGLSSSLRLPLITSTMAKAGSF
jgi:DNA-binding NtrC family response regulator